MFSDKTYALIGKIWVFFTVLSLVLYLVSIPAVLYLKSREIKGTPTP